MNTDFLILDINLFGLHLTDVDGWTALIILQEVAVMNYLDALLI